HTAHAALAQRTDQRIGADAAPSRRHGRQQRGARTAGEKTARIELVFASQQGLERRRGPGVVPAQRGEPLRALRARQIERLVKQRTQTRERLGPGPAHSGGSLSSSTWN